MFHKPRCKVKCVRMATVKAVSEVQLRQLHSYGIIDALSMVAGVNAPQSGGDIQQAITFRVMVVHAVSGDDKSWAFLEVARCRKGHPKAIQISRNEIVIEL